MSCPKCYETITPSRKPGRREWRNNDPLALRKPLCVVRELEKSNTHKALLFFLQLLSLEKLFALKHVQLQL